MKTTFCRAKDCHSTGDKRIAAVRGFCRACYMRGYRRGQFDVTRVVPKAPDVLSDFLERQIHVRRREQVRRLMDGGADFTGVVARIRVRSRLRRLVCKTRKHLW